MKKWLLLVVLLIGFTCPPSQALAVETQTSGEISFFEVEQPVNQPSPAKATGERTTTDQRRPATGIGNDDPTACEFNRATTGVADATDFVDKTI